MSTHHISLDDTQSFGPSASQRVREQLDAGVPVLNEALVYVCDELDHATDAVGSLLASARESDDATHGFIAQKRPALAAAHDLLVRFSSHLDAQPTEVNRRRFFTHDGTVRGVGSSASRVVLALTNIAHQLAKKAPGITDATTWHAQFQSVLHSLSPAVAHAQSTKTARAHMTPELEAARAAWVNTYTALKCIAEGVLRLNGSLSEMPAYFDDLAAPHARATTAAPGATGAGTPAAGATASASTSGATGSSTG